MNISFNAKLASYSELNKIAWNNYSIAVDNNEYFEICEIKYLIWLYKWNKFKIALQTYNTIPYISDENQSSRLSLYLKKH